MGASRSQKASGDLMLYPVYAFISVLLFAFVHLFAGKISKSLLISHGRFLSAANGVAIAYVFVDILPKLSKGDALVKETLRQIFPYFERHVYVLALLGFLLFFVVDRSQELLKNRSTYFYLSLSSYALFNFLVGYAIVDKDNPEVQPLVLFTFAMTLHYFLNDYSLSKDHKEDYKHFGKWFLIASLFLGWIVGIGIELSETAVALVSAFIGGGVMMNVTRHELPRENPHSLVAFLAATAIYTAVLLGLGAE